MTSPLASSLEDDSGAVGGFSDEEEIRRISAQMGLGDMIPDEYREQELLSMRLDES